MAIEFSQPVSTIRKMSEPDTSSESPPQPSATLLFVDDEPSILSSLRRLFRPRGYKILTAESGTEGLKVIEQEPIDLIISDMRMPEMDGAKFLQEVRARKPDITRLLLTGYADITSTIAAINCGEIYRYISKPWDDNDILLVVREALEHKRLKSENLRLIELTQQQNQELKSLNEGLEERVRQRTAEIEQVNSFLNMANDKMKKNFVLSIKVFSGLMELREGGVSGHARRVADLSRKIGNRLGLDARTQQDVFVAGLLHDIGKIGFPDSMLGKPVSKFNSDELARYRKHAVTGESALMPLTDMKEVAQIIRAHHERFDGGGFPDGAIGDAIPLGARILSIANDFDGLQNGTLSERRFSIEDARSTVIHGRGKKYDPQVTDAFAELTDPTHTEQVREREVTANELEPGLTLSRDLLSREGSLLLAADFVLDPVTIRQIQEYGRREGIRISLHVRTEKKPQDGTPPR